MSRLLILLVVIFCMGCKNKLETEPSPKSLETEPSSTPHFRKVGGVSRPGYVVTAAAACRTYLFASTEPGQLQFACRRLYRVGARGNC
jgi:hypothetical protein